jgi:AraC family transcriptional regulator, transcriptional activator of pobA
MTTTLSHSNPFFFKGNQEPATGLLSNDNSHRFEIHTIEWLESNQYITSSAAEKIDHYEVLFIIKGKGSLVLDGQHHVLTDNSIHCVFPGNIRKINIDPGTEGYYISFAIEFLKLSDGYCISSAWLEEYNNYSKVASTTIDHEMQPEFETFARKLKWEYNNYFDRKSELLKGLLNIFLIYFSRNMNTSPRNDIPSKEKELANKFFNLLKKYYSVKKLVNDYALLLAVTPNFLNRTIKKITGFTTSHHIQQQIILEAKRQAIYSSVSMKQIAYSLGFDTPAHFSKFFKNNCGINFTEYKKGITHLRAY